MVRPAIVLLLLCLSPNAFAEVAEDSAENESSNIALSLAEHFAPLSFYQKIIDDQMAAFLTNFTASPKFQDIEKQYPGAGKVVISAIRSKISDQFKSLVPAWHKNFSILFSRKLDISDLIEIDGFYGSPIGQSILGKARATVNWTTAIQASNRDSVSPELQEQFQTVLSDAELKAIKEFSSQPAAQRWAELQPQFKAMEAEQLSAVKASGAPIVKQSVMEALQTHITSFQKGGH